AMINIEMIGRTNVGGHNTFFVTGFNYSNLGEIIKKNLEGSIVKMINEPNPERLLFARSDNLPFAMRSVPAHTIMSSSDLDDCYHQTCDEWETMNFVHMRNVVEAIILATKTIIEGKETPQRISRKVENPF
ncbi:MAG: M28 family metallopeptidase, partial [Flavisolibacter sp.]